MEKIVKNDEWIDKISDLEEIELSEYDKYKLVDNFYKSFNSDGEYLKKFYETLEILDSGYMSERKSSAQRIFREIYNVDVIPEKKLGK